ncbi:MAG: helix-turn-helix domain-containing protein [Kiloniellales bacterium]
MKGDKRKQAVDALKRDLILQAASRVFETEGLEGASLRAIAAEAGYTPAALYFHFASKEALYAALLDRSLAALKGEVDTAAAEASTPADRLLASALAFYRFYADNPRDLDLGFYLFRGGMKPRGLGEDHDQALNRALMAALDPIGEAAESLGLTASARGPFLADLFAHMTGLLLLEHTGRIRMFGTSGKALITSHLEQLLAKLAPAH